MPKHDPYEALRYSGYRRFLFGSLLMNLGAQSVEVAAGYQIYAQTHSPWSLAMIGLARYLPVLFLGLPAGDLADRIDRRKILVSCALWSCLSFGLLAWLSRGGASAWVWYLLLFSGACAASCRAPAALSFYPNLLERPAIPNAVTWNSSNFQSGAIAGPVIGGFLVRLGGAPLALAFGAFGGLAYGLVMLGLKPLRQEERKPQDIGILQRVIEGWRHARGHRDLFAAMVLDMVAVFFGGVEAVMPIFAKDILHVDSVGLGLLKAAPFAGALVMGLALAHRPPMLKAGRAMLLSVLGFGGAIILFGLSKIFWLSLFALGFSGALDNISVVVRQTLAQVRPPDYLKGRVQSISFLFIGSSNELGEVESGVAAAALGPVASVAAGGMMVWLTVGLVSLLWPELRSLGKLRD
jgi:MFS family permease